MKLSNEKGLQTKGTDSIRGPDKVQDTAKRPGRLLQNKLFGD